MALFGSVIPSDAQGGFNFKNKVINGAMQVWQRGTSGTSSNSADMFTTENRNAAVTINWAQSTDVPTSQGFAFSQRIFATGATDDGFHFRTAIELPATANYGEFQPGTKWTLSFWMKSAYTGRTIRPILYLADAVGGANTSGSVVPDQGTQTITQSWEKYTLTYTLPTWTVDNGSLGSVKCLVIRMLQGTNDTPQDTYFTGLQLEKGSVATPFEFRPIGVETALCQRYYYAYSSSGLSDNVYLKSPYVNNFPNSSASVAMYFPTTMRAAPTMSGTIGGASVSRQTSTTDHAVFQMGSTSGATAYALTSYTATAEL